MKMNKRHVTVSVLILLLIAGLTSCGNLFLKTGNKPQPAPVMTGRLEGSVTTTGALPSQIAGVRSAFPGLQFTSGETKYAVQAIPTDTSKETVSGTFTGTNFVITGLELGVEYNVRAQLLYSSDNSVLLEGTALPITLTAASPSHTTGEIDLQAKSTATGTGDIYLCIDLADETISSVTKVVATLQKFTGESFTETQTLSFVDVPDHSVAINFTNIPSGARRLSLSFYKTQGSTDLLVYHCNEMVNVFDNLLTDWWVQNGAEKHFTTISTETHFIISNTCLESFIKTSWFVNPDAVTSGTGTQYSPFKTLQEAFTAANASGQQNVSIFIKAGTTNPAEGPEDGIEIGSGSNSITHLTLEAYDVTNDARAATITKTSAASTILVYSGNLSVSNISFTNPDGKTTNATNNGGFVTVKGSACSIVFTNCSFQGGKTTEQGGAIRNTGSLTISGCKFTSNQASSGMAIYSEGPLTLVDSSFNGNAVDDDHNSIVFKNTLTLGSNLQFSGIDEIELWTPETVSSDADKSTARITLDSAFSLTTESFKIKLRVDFPANHKDQKIFTSGLSSAQLNKFYTAERSWGISEDGYLIKMIVVQNGQITNYADTLDNAMQLALDKGKIATITLEHGKEYELTQAPELTGNDTSISIISDSDTEKATVTMSEGLTFNNGASISATNIAFVGSGTRTNFGGMFTIFDGSGTNPATANFTNCSFTNGKTQNLGGAIYVAGSLSLTSCTFEGNKQYVGATEQGNGIYGLGNAYISFAGQTTFSNDDYIQLNGPQIELLDSDAKQGYVYIEGLSGDSTTVFSGLYGSYVPTWFTCANSGFEFDDSGKAVPEKTIVVTDGSKTVMYASLNSAIDAIITTSGDFYSSTTNITITLNHAVEYTYSLTSSISSKTFTINSDDTTQKVLINMAKPFSVDETTLTLNSLHLKGTVKNGTSGGGLIFMNNFFGEPKVTCINCKFEKGTTSQNGGAIYNTGTLTLDTCEFNGNTADGYGNGIYCISSSKLNIKGETKFDESNEIYLYNGSEDSSQWPTIELLDNVEKKGAICVSNMVDGAQLFSGTYVSEAANWFTYVDQARGIDRQGRLSKAASSGIFIAPYGDDDYGTGRRGKPYRTLTKALQNLPYSDTTYPIYIEEGGTYDYSSEYTVTVDGDITISACNFYDYTTVTSPFSTVINIVNYPIALNEGSISFTGLTFTRNNTGTMDGGLINNLSILNFKNCVFCKGRSRGEGGAIMNTMGQLSLDACLFYDNIEYVGIDGKERRNSLYVGEDSESVTIKGNTFFGNDPVRIGNVQAKLTISSDVDRMCGLIYCAKEDHGTWKNFTTNPFTTDSSLDYSTYFCYANDVAGTDYHLDKAGNPETYISENLDDYFPGDYVAFLPTHFDSIPTDSKSLNIYLNLRNIPADSITEIESSLPDVYGLVLPGVIDGDGIPEFTTNKFGNDSSSNAPSLRQVELAGNVYGDWLFQSCNIESAVIHEGVTFINSGMFSKNTQLKSAILPSTLTSIGYHAFANSSIETIIIPASVTSIEWYPFFNTSATDATKAKLKYVIFEDPTGWVFDGSDVDFSNPIANAEYFKNHCTTTDDGKAWTKN